MTHDLVAVRNLVKHFPTPRAGVLGKRDVVHAVEGADLDVREGEILALVGESGSGKTTLANCIAGFVDPTEGTILFGGRPYVEVSKGRVVRSLSRREVAPQIQMIFQDPTSALNPRQRIGSMLLEPLLVHRLLPKAKAKERVAELLVRTGVGPVVLERYPHELNSGQRQRVVIARALTLNPRLLIADEPIAKLDVSTQGQILNLLLDLHRDLGITMIFITHDLSAVRQVADRVVVMYLGRIMEACDADSFFANPVHPYSEALVASTPRFGSEASDGRVIRGEIPSPVHPPPGCPFTTRCPIVTPECSKAVPPLQGRAGDRLVACIRR